MAILKCISPGKYVAILINIILHKLKRWSQQQNPKGFDAAREAAAAFSILSRIKY